MIGDDNEAFRRAQAAWLQPPDPHPEWDCPDCGETDITDTSCPICGFGDIPEGPDPDDERDRMLDDQYEQAQYEQADMEENE